MVSILWIGHGREPSRKTLRSWLRDPQAFEFELSSAFFAARAPLVLGYQPNGEKYNEATARTRDFFGLAVQDFVNGLEEFLSKPEGHQPTKDEKLEGILHAKLLNAVTEQIYFGSGAFRSGNDDKPRLETLDAKRAFLADMQPILKRIGDVGTPRTIHHLIDLLDFLAPADPPAAFDLVAHALLNAGRRHGYEYESLGADRFVEIVGQFLADHRDIFDYRNQDRRQKLVNCLEAFQDAGWPSARRLLYRLPELLQ